MGEAALAVAALLVVLTAVRGSLAAAAIASPARVAPAQDLADVTVLVAVRSGDPLLPDVLASSVRTLAPARVLLLVDHDDTAGRAAATAAAAQATDPDAAVPVDAAPAQATAHEAAVLIDAAEVPAAATAAARRAPAPEVVDEVGAVRGGGARRPHVEVVVCPPPEPGVNPKIHKLALADVQSGTVVLLDDDTAFPAGGLARLVGALADADLATGVPVYREQGGLWSRLLAAFVNGSALVTYLPLARVGPPVSINGMVVALRRDRLEAVGGFPALATATCDDYALARLFRAHGLRVVQTAQPALVATTVPGAAAYLRIVRRWLLFAGEVVRRDLSARLLLLVLVPTALPLATVALAVASGSLAAVGAAVAALAVSALVTRALRRQVTAAMPPDAASADHMASPIQAGPPANAGVGAGWLGVLLEPVAAVLAPLQALAAQLGPRTVTWRGRRVRVGIGSAP
ncbi:glycosyltransferase [Cellulomonas algicola]|uniref:glycosyltransferase n=1 Tax=Cellulomonas algicola TaxID=2071633 RepID=UPI001C3FB6CC|nr:glycosyltransferase [Cellulomonas algicola]